MSASWDAELVKAREALSSAAGQARALPYSFYDGRPAFELDAAAIFHREWVAIAFSREVAASGSVLPVSTQWCELFLARSKAGTLKAFYNFCPHRGMTLVQHAEVRRHLSCPWHRWVFDLDGALVATPNATGHGRNERPTCLGEDVRLREVLCIEWGGLVFVNLSTDEIEPFADFIAPVRQAIGFDVLDEHELSDAITEVDFAANWKMFIEGGLEDYHFYAVHPDLAPSKYFQFSNLADRALRVAARPAQAEDVLSDSPEIDHVVVFGLPTAIFAIEADHVLAGIILPAAPDRTVFRFSVLPRSNAQASPEDANAMLGGWREIVEQDQDLLAGWQSKAKVRAQSHISGRFVPYWEEGVHDFQRYVIDRLGRDYVRREQTGPNSNDSNP